MRQTNATDKVKLTMRQTSPISGPRIEFASTHLVRAMVRVATLFAFLAFILPSALAQQVEQSVKAAFLYNFTKFVTWPAGSFDSPASAIIIGVVGEDSLGGALEEAVTGKTVDGRRLVVRHYRWGQDLSGCQVLFVPGREMASANKLAELKDQPILIVGEFPGFARRFGTINFVIEADKVRFEINGKAARDAGLTISSKLLNLGRPPQ